MVVATSWAWWMQSRNADSAIGAAADVQAGREGGLDGVDEVGVADIVLGISVGPPVDGGEEGVGGDAEETLDFGAYALQKNVVGEVEGGGGLGSAEKRAHENVIFGARPGHLLLDQERPSRTADSPRA